MVKELKYIFCICIILTFFTLSVRYYTSDKYEKNFYKSLNNLDLIIENKKQGLVVLKNNTNNIKKFIDDTNNKQKKLNFWELLDNENQQ
tara:strand:- start:8792 stop:9058 length:267 start_codon:yes stop_codon:yes gene_type:complete